MKRLDLAPRANWQQLVEDRGLVWHTVGGQPYWNESACYSFTPGEIEEIEAATAELYRLFLEAGQVVVDEDGGLDAFGIPRWLHDEIRKAWNAEPPAINYGRFDLGFDGKGPPKLFEFNCDTPTSLLEAAIIQWDWKEAVFPSLDQFNSLHEKLVAKWADIRSYLPGQQLHFTHVADNSGSWPKSDEHHHRRHRLAFRATMLRRSREPANPNDLSPLSMGMADPGGVWPPHHRKHRPHILD